MLLQRLWIKTRVSFTPHTSDQWWIDCMPAAIEAAYNAGTVPSRFLDRTHRHAVGTYHRATVLKSTAAFGTPR
jgi:hypothetical protein